MKLLRALLISVNAAVSAAFIVEGAVYNNSLLFLGILTLALSLASVVKANVIGRMLYCSSSIIIMASFSSIAYISAIDTAIYSSQGYLFTEGLGIAGALVFIFLILIACSAAW